MAPARYCIDSSSFLDAWYRSPIDVFPTLWERLSEVSESGVLISPEEVRQELRHPQELRQWTHDRDEMFWDLDDTAYQSAVTQVVDRFRLELKQRRLRLRPTDFKADPFVVALAKTENAVVVCEEKLQLESGGRPKLPNVCEWYGVRAIGFVEFLREMGWQF